MNKKLTPTEETARNITKETRKSLRLKEWIDTGKRKCYLCNKVKLFEDFGSDAYQPLGLSSKCRKCYHKSKCEKCKNGDKCSWKNRKLIDSNGDLVKKQKTGHKLDLINHQFEQLTVISETDKPNPNFKGEHTYWLCKCSCGQETILPTYALTGRGTKSCGCRTKISASLPDKIGGQNVLFRSYKQNAKYRDILFDLPKELFIEMTSSNCYYCNKAPSHSCKALRKNINGDYIYNGVDRLNCDSGYIKDNCVPCCNSCNKAKMVLTKEEFFDMIKRIYEHHKLNELS